MQSVDVDPFSEVRVHQPVDFPFAFSVSLSGGDGLPKVTVEMTNTSEERYAVQTANYGLPFIGSVGENGDGGAIVAGVGESVLYGNDDDGLDCKVGKMVVHPAPNRAVLAPGDTVDSTQTVATYTDSDVCWPEGTFSFGQGYDVWSADAAFRTGFTFDLVI